MDNIQQYFSFPIVIICLILGSCSFDPLPQYSSGGCFGECNIGETRSCTTTCGTEGIEECDSCDWSGVCLPPWEICNGIDDDCDGNIDATYSVLHEPIYTSQLTVRDFDIFSNEEDDFLVRILAIHGGAVELLQFDENIENLSEPIEFAREIDCRISSSPHYASVSAVTGDRTNGIVWIENQGCSDDSVPQSNLAFVSFVSGEEENAHPFRIPTHTMTENIDSTLDMCWNGREYAIAWSDEVDGQARLHLATIPENASSVDDVVFLPNEPTILSSPVYGVDLACTSSGYALTYIDGERLVFSILTPQGEALQTSDIDTVSFRENSSGNWDTSLLWNGETFVLLWHRIFVGTHLVQISSDGILISDPLSLEDRIHPAIAWTGTEYILITSSQRIPGFSPQESDILLHPYSSEMELLEPPILIRENEYWEDLQLVQTTNGFTAVWDVHGLGIFYNTSDRCHR